MLDKLLILVLFIGLINCHGRMDDPPSRGSAWRFLPGFPTDREDYNLAHSFGLAFCGSVGHQYGGLLYTGKIVKTYSQGDVIPIHTFIAINHGGGIQMSLCPVPNDFSKVEATQECLDAHKLQVINGSLYDNDIYKAKLIGNERSFDHYVKLPDDISCDHCVIQWKWYAVSTGEIFTNCADIKITPKQITTRRPTRKITTTTSTTTTTTTTTKTPTKIQVAKFVCSKGTPPPASSSQKTPLLAKYSAVLCFWDVSKYGPMDCDLCKENCLSTDTEDCPEECQCRWYA